MHCGDPVNSEGVNKIGLLLAVGAQKGALESGTIRKIKSAAMIRILTALQDNKDA